MKEFKSVKEAFEYFLENILPQLSPEKRRKLKDVKHDYYKEERKVSDIRMKRVLKEYGSFEIIYRCSWDEGK